MQRTWTLLLSTIAAVSACALPTRQPVMPAAGGLSQASGSALGLAGSGMSALVERDMQRLFRLHDRNGDGHLTATEADLPDSVMAELDKDSDSRLSRAEMMPPAMVQSYTSAMQGFATEAFDQLDGDRNGRISAAELTKGPMFGELDHDFRWSRDVRSAGWDKATFERQITSVLSTMPDWQPVRTAMTSKKTPILLVQGYLEPSYYFMYGIYRHLQKQGWPVYGINLFPNVAHAEVQARKVEAKIQEIRRETGSDKINLVCHSFGGLIARHVIQKMGGYKYVDRYVSIATPHFGTAWCYLPGTGDACDVMRLGGSYLAELNQKPIWSPVRYSTLYTKTDEITIPPKNCILPGATNYPPVPKTGHFLILWSPTTYQYVDEALNAR
jgi:hypothetical protein